MADMGAYSGVRDCGSWTCLVWFSPGMVNDPTGNSMERANIPRDEVVGWYITFVPWLSSISRGDP